MRIYIITGLLLFINNVYTTPVPVSIESDESSSSEENGLVYVFNIYAVKNTNTREVANMLNQKSLEKLPSKFEPIGSVLYLDEDSDEIFGIDDFAEELEEVGITVNKINGHEESNVIEIKLDYLSEEYDDFEIIGEWLEYLQTDGIMIKIHIGDANATVIELPFEISEQETTNEELMEFFQNDAFTTEIVQFSSNIRIIKFTFIDEDSEQPEKSINGSLTIQRTDERKNQIEKDVKINEIQPDEDGFLYGKKVYTKTTKNNSFDSKTEKKDERFDDHLLTIADYITRADSLNKIRRRRSVCPECKFSGFIKQFVIRK